MILFFDKTDSTNDFLNKHYRQFSPPFFVIAKYQTKGRGAGNNTWESQKDKNLLFSALVKLNLQAEKQYLLAQAVSLALIDYLDFHNIQALIKWPNDILVDKKKIAGILIENKINGKLITNSIIGIGLNLNQKTFENLPQATSLSAITNKHYEIFLEFLILKKFLLTRLENINEAIKAEYLDKLFGFGETLHFKSSGGIFYGKIIDVDNSGRLVVKTSSEIKKFFFKEVEFLIYTEPLSCNGK